MYDDYFEPKLLKFIKTFPSIESANAGLTRIHNITVSTITTKNGEMLYSYDCGRVYKHDSMNSEANMFMINSKREFLGKGFNKPLEYKLCPHGVLTNLNNALVEQCVHGVRVTLKVYNGELIINVERDSKDDLLVDPKVIEEFLCKKLKTKNIVDELVNDKYCWIFKYTSPTFDEMSKHLDEDLVLLGMYNVFHNTEVIKYYTDSFAASMKFSRPWSVMIRSLSEVEDILDNLTPLDEGIIVRNIEGERFSFPNNNFNIMNRILRAKDSTLAKSECLNLFKNNYDCMDFIKKKYTKLASVFDVMEKNLSSFVSEVEIEWDTVRNAQGRKEFIERIKNSKNKDILLAIRTGRIQSIFELIEEIPDEILLNKA